MKKVIGISRIKKELYLVKYQIEFREWFKKKTKIIERMVIEDSKTSLLPFTYRDDGKYLHRDDGEDVLKWMSRNNISSFDGHSELREMQQ